MRPGRACRQVGERTHGLGAARMIDDQSEKQKGTCVLFKKKKRKGDVRPANRAMLEADETPAGPPAGRCTGSSCSTAEKVALAATVAGQSARIWSVAGRARCRGRSLNRCWGGTGRSKWTSLRDAPAGTVGKAMRTCWAEYTWISDYSIRAVAHNFRSFTESGEKEKGMERGVSVTNQGKSQARSTSNEYSILH
jgi:hypothetical protein